MTTSKTLPAPAACKDASRSVCLLALFACLVLAGCDEKVPAPGESAEAVPPALRFRGQMIPVGTLAPDFSLSDARTGGKVQLADLLERRPVVIVLGSFGCDYFCFRLDALRDLHTRFGERANFLFVYIDNNHPEPDLPMKNGGSAEIHLSPDQERLAKIRAGLDYFDIRFPCLIDSADKRVQTDYEAFPARLFIIDQDGKIALDSGTVTRTGLNLEDAETWLEKLGPG